jgi:murein DD-endopeptidase MepM/ murein hydrolase activator NlpD
VRQYIAPATAYSSGHRGVDLAAGSGTVYAPADGIVHFAGVVVDRPVLSIRHPGGLISSYEPLETTLQKGEAVSRGAPVGTVIAGHCSPICLHFGVRLDGEYVSPLLYLGGIGPSVLLPTRR